MNITQDLLKPSVEHFSTICSIVGVLLLLLGAPALALPRKTAALWRAFPRSIWPGRILAVLGLAWAAAWLMAMPLGPLMVIRHYMAILLPVAIVAVWFLCDELLSCRAVGGLLVLVPTVLLSSAQWHTSALRYIPLIEAYLFAVAGMFVIAKPYLLRDAMLFCAATPKRMPLGGGVLALLGALLLAAALFA